MYRFSELFEPDSLQEALEILNANPDCKIIAGGTDILIKIRKKDIKNIPLVSLNKIKSLSVIRETTDRNIEIGSMVTFSQANKDPIINKHLPILAEAAITMGGPQIRNKATLGGNICNGATSADSAPPMLALKAKLTIESFKGTRFVDIESFYKGLYQVDMNKDEILTKITIPPIEALWGGHYTKFSPRKAMDISTLGCAVVCLLKDKKTMQEIRIALGTAAPTPIRCHRAEKLAVGEKPTEQLLKMIGEEIVAEAKPRSSWRASREFRVEIMKELASRTIKKAFLMAGGELS